MNAPLAYFNGRFLPFREASLPLHDAGFVSGATVVDNARTFRHKLFRWPDHVARFRRDCEACYVPLESSDERLTALAEELVSHNAKLLPPGGELQLVTFATPGPLGFYLEEVQNGPPTLGLCTYPLPFGRYRNFFTDGATLAAVADHFSSGSIKPSEILPPTVKHRSRLYWHIADSLARKQSSCSKALALIHGNWTFTETSTASFLAIIDGVVISPPREEILDGISLRVVGELCASLGVPLVKGPVTVADLRSKMETMLTGTAFCLAGVSTLHIPAHPTKEFAWPGPIYRKLLAAWSDLVGVDIEKQFTETV